MKKQRAKWGSKTRHGKAIVPSDGSLRPYIAEDVRPRIPRQKNLTVSDKLEIARTVFATMIIEGHDKNWSSFITEKVRSILV